jgi:hypothetical protein
VKKISDKMRLDFLLAVIRGGHGYVPACWIDRDGSLTGRNVRTRLDIDICIAAIRASKKPRGARK